MREALLQSTTRHCNAVFFLIILILAVDSVPSSASSHIGRFTNWDYEIGHGSFTAEEQQAILNYAAGQCEPVRESSAQGSVSKVPLKAKPGALSHITLELFSIPRTADNLVRKLAKEGVKSICYFSGGSLNTDRNEDRAWAKTFARLGLLGPPVRKFSMEYRSECYTKHKNSTLAAKIADDHCYWGDNRWLLPSDGPDMKRYFATRIQMCKERGFTGVEADNMDAASQEELRGQTSSEQGSKMIRMLSSLCHDNEMSCGLKNAGAVAGQFVRDFDFGIVERCNQFHECPLYAGFKTILAIEYDDRELPTGPNILAIGRGESEMKEIVGLLTKQCGPERDKVVSPAAVGSAASGVREAH